MGIITGTICPMIQAHWQDQREQLQDQQRNASIQRVYQRLNADEQSIAVLQQQMRDIGAVGMVLGMNLMPLAVRLTQGS